LLFEKGVL